MKKILMLGVTGLLAVVLVLGAMAFRGGSVESVAENLASNVRYLPVATMVAKQTDRYQITKTYTGEIVARRTSDLGFERAGRLESVLVREGSVVTKGDAIATMEKQRLTERLRELAAAEWEAMAVLDELLAGPRSQELRIAVERVNELRAQLRYARSTHKRVEGLLLEDVGSIDQVDNARAREEQLSAALKAAEQTLDEMNEGTRKEKIQAQQARVEQLAARTALLQIDIEDSTVRAPYDGCIAARYADEGSVLDAGTPVVQIVEDGAPTAWIGMSQESGQEVQIGDSVMVRSLRQEYKGMVAAVLPQLHAATRTTTVVIDLEVAERGALPPGQVVSFDTEQIEEGQGFWLPSDALVRGTRGLWACLVVTETREETSESNEDMTLGLLQRRDLEVLHATESRVFVRGMLSDGEQVVGVGTHRVVPGQWVQVNGA